MVIGSGHVPTGTALNVISTIFVFNHVVVGIANNEGIVVGGFDFYAFGNIPNG
jgi:hypothetical protein